ncbi:MAG: ABC transporter ATP-binding protein [Candidatus Omnitrophica bacterium]|nr:ABC transporter ATP-binding protein [Candidatus Omnitrophota bacterium]
MQNLLSINNLRVGFSLGGKSIEAVKGVNLKIGHNEAMVLAGESGSGKSITSFAITKILPANARIIAGEVYFGGEDLLKLDEKALADVRGSSIAYIFQEPSSFLNPVYTIGSQISEVIMLHQRKSREEAGLAALELLQQVKINDTQRVSESYPHQLSGGMNQRAFIAMSLACKPKLLIADEPTTSLDVTIEAEILQLLMQLKRQLGFSLLFITHNLSIAKRIADRVSIMYQGKIVEEGSCAEIFSSPKHFHTRELIQAYEKIGKL